MPRKLSSVLLDAPYSAQLLLSLRCHLTLLHALRTNTLSIAKAHKYTSKEHLPRERQGRHGLMGLHGLQVTDNHDMDTVPSGCRLPRFPMLRTRGEPVLIISECSETVPKSR